jgi:hypothetical protein
MTGSGRPPRIGSVRHPEVPSETANAPRRTEAAWMRNASLHRPQPASVPKSAARSGG